jgi:hypothetical protein
MFFGAVGDGSAPTMATDWRELSLQLAAITRLETSPSRPHFSLAGKSGREDFPLISQRWPRHPRSSHHVAQVFPARR